MTGAEFRGVDIDLLADYIGGALAGTPDESVVAALIADDPAWRDAFESLSGGMSAVEDELGRLGPLPMPDDVAARLEEAFAAPRLTLVQDAGDGADAVREKELDLPKRRPGRRLRWATPIAIAAGAVAFVGFGLDYLAGRDTSTSDKAATSTAGGAADSAARQDNNPEAPAMAESGPGSGSAVARKGQASPPPQVLESGTNYTKKTLAIAPAQALSSRSAAVPAAPAPLARLNVTSALQECLDLIAGENGAGPITTETVDYAKFDGKPAIVVRFTAGNGAWAWASGPSCGTLSGHADTLAKVPVR
ncbi:hypothetical protein ACQPZX_49640 [Actinoplanes sp. CA-142083]|uniref:hypothetical protein n=1 Tax=Actinoplanes sp. CA-142083 TaxID=3239903 RepID=UPI003D9151C6